MFSQRLKQLRTSKGIRQEDLAAALGMSRGTLAGYEAGRRVEPDHETLGRIADYFNVSVDYLLGRSDDPTPPDPSKPMDVDQLITLALSVDGGHDALDERDIQEVREFIELVRRKRRMKREQQQGDDQK